MRKIFEAIENLAQRHNFSAHDVGSFRDTLKLALLPDDEDLGWCVDLRIDRQGNTLIVHAEHSGPVMRREFAHDKEGLADLFAFLADAMSY